MKHLYALLIILGVCILLFWQLFFKSLLPIPSDALVGLYHPFRDFYAKEYSRGFPFKNFLITDPVRQQYEWRFLGIEQEKSGDIPLWNPYNGMGMPLLANQQSSLLYPLNILFFILPFPLAWSLGIFLTPILGAFFLYLYLKQLKISFTAALLASLTFIFCGFMTAWLEWNTVAQSLIWLPFILWSIENSFKVKGIKHQGLFSLLVSFGLVCSFLAGHLQTFFYVSALSSSYLFLKAVATKQIRRIFLFIVAVFVFFAIGSFQLIPTLQLIILSARNIDVNWTNPGWFIPIQHLIQFIIPDFFGNPATLNYWGVWNYGELVGYIGVIPFIFALFGGIFIKRKVVYYFLGVSILSLLFATANPIAALPFIWHIPFLSTSQPTRLISLIDFSLIILSAFGIDFLKKAKKRDIIVVGSIFVFVFLSIWGYLFVGNKFFSLITSENLAIAKRNSIFPTGLFLVTIIALSFIVLFRNRKVYIVIIFALFMFSLYDEFRFSTKFNPFTPQQFLFPQTKTMTFLKENTGIYRYITTDDRILPPNVGTYYHLQSIDSYDPLYLQQYGELIAAMQRGKPNISTPFGFNRIVTPHAFGSPLINLMGVKYIVSLSDINNKNLKKVFQEGQTRVYENMSVFPRAFFVEKTLTADTKEEAISYMFNPSINLSQTAIIEGFTAQNYIKQKSLVSITSYQPNHIVLKTDTKDTGFLVLTDTYYPTWHAYVDGKEVPIVVTDYTFRGIEVTSGKHTIVFKDKLF